MTDYNFCYYALTLIFFSNITVILHCVLQKDDIFEQNILAEPKGWGLRNEKIVLLWNSMD
jgi:hypothetical protein